MKRLTLSLFAVLALAVQAQAAIPEPTGLWEFNGPDPNAATIGAPLELVGLAEEIFGIDEADGAITIGEGSYYVCTHGVAPNGDGAKVNEWTLLIDFAYVPSSLNDPPNGYNDLFQTDPTNASDSDWTINSSGAVGIGAVGYTSAVGFSTEADIWYRMVVVVDNGVLHDVYFDGELILQGNQQGIDGRFSLEETLGHVDAVGVLLAASVLLWIPSHILTLTIRYADDYARAGVPAWPNAYGPRSARLVIAAANLLNAVVLTVVGWMLHVHPAALISLFALSLGIFGLSAVQLAAPSERCNWVLFKAASFYMLASCLLLTVGSLA